MSASTQLKIYHIVHVNNLLSILADGFLWSDAEVNRRNIGRTLIGMSSIKQRRLSRRLSSRPNLCVGECVPFYFCPRSVMLFVISQRNHSDLLYRDGQEPIVHLECDMHKTIEWADSFSLRWAFTLSNAGSFYFEDRCSVSQLNEIDWNAVRTNSWGECKEKKQAEFLVERNFPWHLVERIGVHSQPYCQQVKSLLSNAEHQPVVEVKKDWYY